MLHMDISRVVHALVEQHLHSDHNKGEALHFHFDLRLSYSSAGSESNYQEKEGEFRQARGLHLLYQVPPGLSYITVFSGITDSPFAKLSEVEVWRHESTHDSCWRDINTFTQVYFEMANLINFQRTEAKLPEVAPAAMSQFNSFALFGPAFQWVPVEITKDPTDPYNYRRPCSSCCRKVIP